MDYTTQKVLLNKNIFADYYLLETTINPATADTVRMGQFYMIRSWDSYPFLSRPISVFDVSSDLSGAEGKLSFLYKIIGEGTKLFSFLKPGDPISLLGPLGNGYPKISSLEQTSARIALVGGSAGIAPLYLAAKQIKAESSKNNVDVFMGFSTESFLEEEYKKIADRVIVNVGGFITDEVDPSNYDYIISCGPEMMMKALYKKCEVANVGEKLYVSQESRMACGVGACFVCSCSTKSGNKKICRDGPVFNAKEVYGI